MCQGVRMTLPFRRPTAGVLLGALALAGLTGCIGNDGGDSDEPECAPAADAMETAKDRIDETSGLSLTLATDDSPSGLAVVAADADVVRPDSFEGTFTGQLSGATLDGEVVGIGDQVWAKAPIIFPDWTEVDPAEYSIPALGALLSGDGGLSSLLLGTDDLGDPRAERDENDTSQILCYYEGTLPGSEIQQVLPSAGDDDFTIEYALGGDGELRKATMTGDFYDNGEDLTYVLDITEYDVEKDIQPPA
jgi:lipoprotein LprG